MKQLLFLFGMMLIFSPSIAFAHPYLETVSINDLANPDSEVNIYGLDKIDQRETNPEFLSDQWVIENFVWMLLSSIGIFIGVVGLRVYREDLSPLKFLKKNNKHDL